MDLIISRAIAAEARLGVPIPGCRAETVSLPEYLGCIYHFATILAIGLAILMIIWGGYKYMASQGNPDAIAEAKDVIVGAIIGLVLLILARLLLTFIGGF